jgi:hypothetical protein
MFEKIKAKFTEIVEKLKREWKTFMLAVMTTAAGAWELAAQMGADLPSLLQQVPEPYKSGVLFVIGFLFLALRKYTPTPVATPEPTVE